MVSEAITIVIITVVVTAIVVEITKLLVFRGVKKTRMIKSQLFEIHDLLDKKNKKTRDVFC